ncbi:MAG: S1C family serine protease, partial [Thiothrix sp.]
GFAIPINTAAGVIAQLVEFGRVERGQLGIQVQDIDENTARDFGLKPNQGALINQIIPESSAAAAGLQAGDIITQLNSKAIQRAIDVKNIIGDLRVGTEVHITILRAGRPRNIRLTVGSGEDQRSSATLPDTANAATQPFWEKAYAK